jgi:cytochrome P450
MHITAYLLSNPQYIESALLTQHRNFIKGRMLQVNRPLLGNGLFLSEGDFWLRQRRLAQPAFHRQRIESYGRVMVEYTERMLASWQDGETRDAQDDMMRLTLQIVAKALFDADIAEEAQEIGAALTAVMEENAGLRTVLRFPSPIPTRGARRLQKTIRRLDEIIYGIVQERRTSGRDTGDLLSMLLDAQDEDGSRMTDRQLRDEVVNIFLGGYETTSLALAWTWYLLSRHPEVEAKLLAELAAVLGGRSPCVADLPELRYTERVILEALRLYPPVWGLTRVARRDCEIGGYVVPAGASVAVCPWVMHRDPRYFNDPEAFLPERWEGDLERRLPRFVYFPFSGGPRICMGKAFAMMEAVLLLATIAQQFRLTLAPGHTVTPLASLTLRPKEGVRMVLNRRESGAHRRI